MNISIIGAGNLAWHLSPELENSGFPIKEVYSRTNKNALDLKKRLYNAETKDDLNFASSVSNLFIIAVPDDVIQNVCNEIILPENAIIIHTSGAKPLEILDSAASVHKGVLYPVQTFKKERKVNFKNVPICIEASNSETEKILKQIGGKIGKNVFELDYEKRVALHVAAVYACNFTNHILTLAEDLCQDQEISFDLLKPLIIETIERNLSLGGKNVQTGPAIRNDIETLSNHNDYLQKDPELKKIYNILTQHIMDYYDL